MPIDPNLILQLQGPKLQDPMDTMVKGMTLKQLVNQNRAQDQQFADDQATREAFRKNMTVGPDGSPTLNRQGVVGDVMKINPQKAFDIDKMIQQQGFEQVKRNTEIGKHFSWSVADDGSNYNEVRNQMIKAGVPASQLPPEVYSKTVVDSWKMHTLSAEEQLKKLNDDRNYQAKLQENANKHEENRIRLAGVNDSRNEKRITALKDDLDPNKARGGNLAKSQAMINSAQRVEGLFSQFPDGNIPKGQTNELAAAVAGLINGGSAQSQHQIDSLTPQSMVGDANAIASWITNEPLGQEQQAFMKLMHETTVREREIATQQVKNAQIQRLSAHQHLAKSDPETYASILRSYDIDPSEIKDGRYSPKQKTTDPSGTKTQAPIKTLKTHEIEWAD